MVKLASVKGLRTSVMCYLYKLISAKPAKMSRMFAKSNMLSPLATETVAVDSRCRYKGLFDFQLDGGVGYLSWRLLLNLPHACPPCTYKLGGKGNLNGFFFLGGLLSGFWLTFRFTKYCVRDANFQ